MRKLLLCLALIMPILAFTGCGGDDEPDSQLSAITKQELESAPSYFCTLSSGSILQLKFQNGVIYTKQTNTDGSVYNQDEIDYTLSGTTIKMQLAWQKSYGIIWKTKVNGKDAIKIDMKDSNPLDSWISHTYLKSNDNF